MSEWVGGLEGRLRGGSSWSGGHFFGDRERFFVVDGCQMLSGLALFLIWCNDTSMSETGRADSISINSTIQPFYQSFTTFEPLTPGIVPLHTTNAQRT